MKAAHSIEIAIAIFALILLLLLFFNFVKAQLTALANQRNSEAFNLYLASQLYIMKHSITKDGIKYINWIDKLEDFEAFGLNISVSFTKEEGTCIYRIVAFGENKSIEKLYFCTKPHH